MHERDTQGERELLLSSRVSLARPVLSCAHYFQAPATQARRPSAVCCEEGSSNEPIMTDTNNGRLKMMANTLALSQNVAGESSEAANGVQMDNR